MNQSVEQSGSSWIDAAAAGASLAEMTPRFPWSHEMDICDHDPVHHAEGSPWTHTGMVAEALESRPEFLMLDAARKPVVRLAAWLHDIGKPATTRYERCEETGRMCVRQPGHAPLGAKMAWQALIDAGVDPNLAREVHALVFWHMRPSHMADLSSEKIFARIARYSAECGQGTFAELMALTRADQDGRIALDDRNKHIPLDLLDLEIDDLETSSGLQLRHERFAFPSEEARIRGCRKGHGALFFEPQPASGSQVTLMSGLPGAGKDTWLARNRPNLPVISFDAIRDELGVSYSENQGRVLQAAFEAARVYLRAGEDFAWNNTNLSRVTREKIVRLVLDYDAYIEAVSIDVPQDVARARNRKRGDKLPDAAIKMMAGKREPVMPDEAHRILSVLEDGTIRAALPDCTRKEAENPEVL